MLERYDANMDPDQVIKSIQEKKRLNKAQAIKVIRKEVPKESYFQDKVKKALQKSYPDAFVAKIAQGQFSRRGIPDILAIVNGHYFGFEIKRPVLGEASRIQEKTIEAIIKAGGTAAFVSYPEEALQIIKDYFKGGQSS